MGTLAVSADAGIRGVRALTVSELARLLRDTVRSNPLLNRILVRGETSNVQHVAGGMVFFTLKDENAQIPCVLFRADAEALAFDLSDGLAVLATGDVDLYARRGEVQLVVRTLAPEGVGRFWATFQATRRKLDGEGLFATGRKRPLPTYPRRVGLVTSERGAVLHDVVTILRRRFPLADVTLSPALVQGPEAPSSLRHALAAVQDRVQVVILARGGGPLEDLWCFNDEGLARAIAACPVPVISAVGHETDVTIADFVADVRAPTPSAAAELASPDADDLRAHLASLADALHVGIQDVLRDRRTSVALAAERLSPAGLRSEMAGSADRLGKLGRGLRDAGLRGLALRLDRLDALGDRLDAVSPLGTLRRGYAIVERDAGGVVTLARAVQPPESLVVRLQDGRLHVHVTSKEETP
ncbi:MAG TPA: exodeoxyribonuclease VII large subunit [Thermoplasmata archaeon]|nr:exodeoxyribonuclease VII large subunit [Thermoplasmata archaeon]